MKKVLFILFSIMLFYTNLLADFKVLNSEELQKAMNRGIKVIDIREAKEQQKTGIIPTSYTMTFFNEKNEYDVKRWMYMFNRVVKNKQQPFVLISEDGKKSEVVGKFLNRTYGYKKIYHLKGGIQMWIDDKKDVVK